LRTDTHTAFYLDSHEVRGKDGYRTLFGGVEVKARYVTFQLMPVYAQPEMLCGISAGLRKRMHGKSCFNFKAVDDALFAELDGLVRTGIDRFAADGRL